MSQRFSAESINNEMILVRTLIFISFIIIIIIVVNCVQAHKIRHYKIALMTWNQRIKTDVETKLRRGMRIRSTKRENMAASCFLG